MDKQENYKIYRYTSPSGGVYIGQTKRDIETRAGNNAIQYRIIKKDTGRYSQPALAHAIIKYGWDNFKKEILFEGLTKEEADEKEIELIKEARKNGECYNIADGGTGLPGVNEVPINMYSLKGEFIRKWNSIREAEEFIGIKNAEANIGACCRGQKYRAYGYIWRYVGSDLPVKPLKPYREPICQFTLDGEYIATFKTIAEASRILGITSTCIGNNLNGWSKTAGGYLWKFKANCKEELKE